MACEACGGDHVDVLVMLPLLIGYLQKRHRSDRPGIVNKNVDTRDRGEQRTGLLDIAQVRDAATHVAAVHIARKPNASCVDMILRAPVNDNCGSCFGQALRNATRAQKWSL